MVTSAGKPLPPPLPAGPLDDFLRLGIKGPLGLPPCGQLWPLCLHLTPSCPQTVRGKGQGDLPEEGLLLGDLEKMVTPVTPPQGPAFGAAFPVL